MSREVRKVDPSWEHPKLDGTLFVPLYDGAKFCSDVYRYEENRRMWALGQVRDPLDQTEWISREEAGVSTTCFEAFHGAPPVLEEYMPIWRSEEATHYMLYETTTLGTPLTPAFASPDELAQWCVLHDVLLCPTRRLTLRGWLKLFRGFTTGQLLREKTDTLLVEQSTPSFA